MKKVNKTGLTTTSRAIVALVAIMRDHQGPHRRIEACEHLLDYECPIEVIEEAKMALMAIVDDSQVLVDAKLDALKLLRRVESRRVSPGRAITGANIEFARAVEIVRRRRALRLSGVFPPPHDAFDDLYSEDYAPLPNPEPSPRVAKSKPSAKSRGSASG